MTTQLTINFHLTKKCNYKCSFCYAHFTDSSDLSSEKIKKLLKILSGFQFRKINFAGGEPFLYKDLGKLLLFAKELGFKTSVITNGSLITKEWILIYGQYLDIMGISCDSGNPSTLKLLGRGRGESAEKTKNVFHEIDEFNSTNKNKIFKKLNTVVTKLNYSENMIDFIDSLNIDRWKIFQVLHIKNENDEYIENLSISNEDFQSFIDRHRELKEKGIEIISESNDAMTDSYLMINPDGKFYQNSSGSYKYSSSIFEVGVEKALSEIYFDYNKFVQRGGVY